LQLEMFVWSPGCDGQGALLRQKIFSSPPPFFGVCLFCRSRSEPFPIVSRGNDCIKEKRGSFSRPLCMSVRLFRLLSIN
jgi:hypothetical protein